ncbi:MAG: tyrosine-type recombinase/integrase [Gemmatimonadaceae bacterium]
MQAETAGKALLAALLRDEEVVSSTALPLSILWDQYRTQCLVFNGYTDRMKKEIEARVQILLAFFGARCDARDLTENDQLAFVQKRVAGGISLGRDKYGKEKVTPKVRPRSAQADMEVLRRMLHWATTYRVRYGVRLLDRNPLAGIRLPSRGMNPRRPVATAERFAATRAAIVALQNEAETDAARRKWLKLELALVLAEAMGRRLGSIRQLSWPDIDFRANVIVWRAANDKRKKDWQVPMSEKLRNELQSFRERLGGAFGGLVFRTENDPTVPLRRDVLSKWLLVAEKKAELPKLDGSLFHAYRRGFVTSKKHLPAADTAAVCGMTVGTLARIYEQPDFAGMLAVVSDDRKVVEHARQG